jgi:hypothetical protein
VEHVLNKYTTKRWSIRISWTDGSSSWHSLSNVKNLHPLQTYTMPAFYGGQKNNIETKKTLCQDFKTLLFEAKQLIWNQTPTDNRQFRKL